jgi:hypothetical protein
MPSMLYINGIPHATRRLDHTLIIYDRQSDKIHRDLLPLARILLDTLRIMNPHYRQFPPPQPRTSVVHHLACDDQPNDQRELAFINIGPPIDIRAMVHHENFDSQSANLEPILYPLLFPTGTPGWSPVESFGLLQYTAARMSQSILMRAFGRTSQQWLCHMHARWRYLDVIAKSNSYAFLSSLQRRLTTYIEHCRHRHLDPSNIGRLACIPSSLHGSLSAQRERINDLAAIAASAGVSDFFITFTCSPDWPECSALKHSLGIFDEHLYNFPDIVARVFHSRNKALRKQLKAIFPLLKWIAQTIEFQKRLLPHSHTLLRSGLTVQQVMSNIDAYVTCRIPSVNDDPELHHLDIQHSITCNTPAQTDAFAEIQTDRHVQDASGVSPNRLPPTPLSTIPAA